MAEPDASEKVLRKEHINWLKMNYALHYMQKGIVPFINCEVKKMHTTLIEKIYNKPIRRRCSGCYSQNIIRDTKNKIWKFRYPCPLECGQWLIYLQNLLPESANPEQIYWTNSDVSKWPFSAWECAKIYLPYLPREQRKSVTGPEMSDSQALMTLLVNCTHFHNTLSEIGLELIFEISTIRNNIVHNSELEISTQNALNWMEKIIKLLDDVCLRSRVECRHSISVIQQIKNNCLDVRFNLDHQMIAWKSAFDEVSREFGVKREETEDSWENKFKNLHAMVKDCHQKMETFQKCQQSCDDRRMRLEIFSHLNERLVSVEKDVQSIKEKSENKKERKPESPDLKQLKRHTEDKLDFFRTQGYIQTGQAEEAKKLLDGIGSLVISGNPGEGKSTMALGLIDIKEYRDQRVVLKCPKDWPKVDKDWVKIVVLEDIFGRFDCDHGRLQEWMLFLPTIQELVNTGKLLVIITIRDNILSEAKAKLGSLNLFSSDRSLTLSSDLLSKSEKMSILNMELHRSKRDVKEEENQECIDKFMGLIGFPLCCLLYARHSQLFDQGPEFFRSPKTAFYEVIAKLDIASFLFLFFLFCNEEICLEHLSPGTMPKSSKSLLMELASPSHLNVSKDKTDKLLDNVDKACLDLYTVKYNSYDFNMGVSKPYIRLANSTICEAVGQIFGDLCPKMLVKYGDNEYLYQRTIMAGVEEGTSQNLVLDETLYGLLAERMVNDIVDEGLVRSVVKHSAMKRYDFLKELTVELCKGDRLGEYFKTMDENGVQPCAADLFIICQRQKVYS